MPDIEPCRSELVNTQERSLGQTIPDIAADTQPKNAFSLDWVGMQRVPLPIRLASIQEDFLIPAEIDVFVNLLDREARGIHMSRLYIEIQKMISKKSLNVDRIREFLVQSVKTQRGLSDAAKMCIRFQYQEQQASLLSKNLGWKNYPVAIQATWQKNQLDCILETTITYSSTCPCSASLARQLIQNHFLEAFGDQDLVSIDAISQWLMNEAGIVANPHSQRSRANVRVRLDKSQKEFPITQLLNQLNQSIKTPVQTVVKRIDEQEFARLNGIHLMFCEDACRLLSQVLENDKRMSDYKVSVQHLESLHAHDAFATRVKGIDGGFKA